jgi:hypothetical protein
LEEEVGILYARSSVYFRFFSFHSFRSKSWPTITGLILCIAFLVLLLVPAGFVAYRRLFAADHGDDKQQQLLDDYETVDGRL